MVLARACGVPVGWHSGGRLATINNIIFFRNFFPPSSTFFIEEVLGSKNLFGKLTGAPKNLGVDTFPDPVGHFGAPWWPFWISRVLGIY